jgi:hypothetical protein
MLGLRTKMLCRTLNGLQERRPLKNIMDASKPDIPLQATKSS